jgi:hypothetical protein
MCSSACETMLSTALLHKPPHREAARQPLIEGGVMIKVETDACSSDVPAHGAEGTAERPRDVAVVDTLQP